jgi:3-(3-hydroxy-phenyl)propionate hydroxylase
MKLNDLASAGGEALDYQKLAFDYVRDPDQDAAVPARHPVVVVGAGPVGLALAIDLAQQGQPVLLLDNDNTLSTGSRAICFAKRTLEIFDRLGCGERMVAKGVSWNLGKVFFKGERIYEFNLLPEPGHARPAFINLQQYYVEGFLAERVAALPGIDVRWNNKVVGVEQQADHAVLTIETPDGPYRLAADYVAACDGSRSALRQLLGQESKGRVFKDRFLIADVKMKLDFPAERWFWFDPAFHPNQSVLLHSQPDNVWRIDFQLGWDADPDEEKKPENIIPRVQALLADSPFKDAHFELEWASVYTFACLRMDSFRHGRVLFAGDSAHGVSPFGARGANSGVQDAENLAWKLAAVLKGTVSGQAAERLLDSYAAEREVAADENIQNSTRATDFITPKSEVSRLFRDAVLALAKQHPFARTLVNSGRLSVPATLHGSPLNTPDADAFAGRLVPGAVAADAPLLQADGRSGWLLRQLSATGFSALVFGAGPSGEGDVTHASDATNEMAERSARAVTEAAAEAGAAVQIVRVAATAGHELAVQRYDATPGTVYLLRPDQHVCARWRQPDAAAIRAALAHALAQD